MKRFFVALIGGTILILGLVMLVLPGPGLLVIGGGLALLASEFLWARRALRSVKVAVAKVRRKSIPIARRSVRSESGHTSKCGDTSAA